MCSGLFHSYFKLLLSIHNFITSYRIISMHALIGAIINHSFIQTDTTQQIAATITS